MTKRKAALDGKIERDFGGGIAEKLAEQRECKFWKEAIERGEFDSEYPAIYIIVPAFDLGLQSLGSYFVDEEVVKKKVYELNKTTKIGEYTYVKLRKIG